MTEKKIHVGPILSGSTWNEISDHYFNRLGEPISLKEWAQLFGDKDYKTVRQEKVANYFVSTVWLGLNHGFGESILIFETMVFNHGDKKENKYSDLLCERFSTEKQAIEGHERIVEETKLLVKLLKESNGE